MFLFLDSTGLEDLLLLLFAEFALFAKLASAFTQFESLLVHHDVFTHLENIIVTYYLKVGLVFTPSSIRAS